MANTIEAWISTLDPISKKGTAIYYDSADVLMLLYEQAARNTRTLDLQAEQARLAKEQANWHALIDCEIRARLEALADDKDT